MGMNMATIATRAAAEVVEAETTASLIALSGNLCTDKKPAAINAVEGRGRSVTADVTIPGAVVEQRLHTTPEAIAEVNTRKNLVGSAVSVSLSSLEVGTVGGGTALPTQRDALELLSVAGGGDPPGSNADALAESIAVGALAGELSLLAALGSRHLSAAHESLGR
jgi:hydroxymethylglutaryl-CoA reductase (NADPH)